MPRLSEDEANYPTKLTASSLPGSSRGQCRCCPTAAELEVFAELDPQLETQLVKWREVLSKDVPALNDAMQKNNIPLIAPTTVVKAN